MSMTDERASRVPNDGTVGASAAAQARLAELADLCHTCRAAFLATADRFYWRPAPGSEAEVLAATLPSPDPLLLEPRAETGHRLVAGVVQTYLLTAAGHLGGLSGLYRTTEVLFTPGMVVRGVIECSARVMWVLGDGNDGPEDLLVRAYLEELLSADEAKKASGRLGGKTTDQYKAREKTYKDLKAEIVGRFPGTTLDDLGRWTLGGQTLLKPGTAVTWMYGMLENHGGSVISSKMAEGIYDYLSNVTHPTLYPTRDLRDWVPSPDHPGEIVAILSVEPDFIERQTSAAVLAYYNALSFVTSFFGWSSDIHDQLTEAIDRVLPMALHDPM
jgi:hypothetical protein